MFRLARSCRASPARAAGQRVERRAAEAGKRARPLAELGWQLAQQIDAGI